MTRGIFPGLAALAAAVTMAVVLSSAVAQGNVTYQQPPRCVVWLEGEDCPEHNWVEGPVWNCWAFGAVGVHGGVLDLASWRLPEAGRYFARFPFELPEDGEYVLYYLGRVPNLLCSPLEWAVDEAAPVEIAADGWEVPGALAIDRWYKVALIRLGTFTATAGKHTLTFTVRKTGFDWIHGLYSAQIDAVGIAPASWPVEPATPPVPLRRPPDSIPSAHEPARPTPDDPTAIPIEVTSGDLSMLVSPHNGGVRGIFLQANPPISLARAQSAMALLKADFRDGTALDCGVVTGTTSGAQGLSLYCRNGPLETGLNFSPGPGPGEISIVARVSNHGESPIWRVQLAAASGLGLGGDAADDTWRVAQDTLTPAEAIGQHRRVSPCQFSFDWVCLTDTASTVYALFEDTRLLDTEVEFGRRDQAGPHGTLAFSKFPRILPGENWTSPPLILGAYQGGDWHRAGDRFSAWWHGWARVPRIPDWLQRIGGMTVGVDIQGEKALQTLPATVQAAREGSGITTFHGAGWMDDTTECWYPVQYILNPDKLRRLREFTTVMRGLGGRTSIYTNGLMLSRASPQYELWGRELIATGPDGRPWLTEHHTHHHPMALPYPNERWAAWYGSIMSAPVLQGRVDMLYVDQLGAVPAHLDFDPDRHGHRHYGEWTAGSARFLQALQDSLGSANPDLVIYTECPCPGLLQFTQLSMYGTTPILRYIFPHYYGLVGPYGDVEPPVALDLARSALLTGEPLLLMDARLEKAEPALRKAVREIIQLKREVDPLLHSARCRDAVGLTIPAGVRASVFAASDGLLIPFAREDAAVEGIIECDPRPLGLQALPARGHCFIAGAPRNASPVQVAAGEEGKLRITIPQGHAGLIVIP